MDRSRVGQATMDESIVRYNDSSPGQEAALGMPLAVLGRFPSLSGRESESEAATASSPPSIHRLLSQSLSFRLLAGTVVVLLVAAVFPAVFGKKSTTTASTSGVERPAWQPEAPAPGADVAPSWSPQGGALSGVPQTGLAQTSPGAVGGMTTAAGLGTTVPSPVLAASGLPQATMPPSGASQPPARDPAMAMNNAAQSVLPPAEASQSSVTYVAATQVEKSPEPVVGIANAPVAIGTSGSNLASISSSAAAIDNVRQAVSESIARANTVARVDGIVGGGSSSGGAPLTWGSFSRRFDAQQASAATVASGVNRAAESPRSETGVAEDRMVSQPMTGYPSANAAPMANASSQGMPAGYSPAASTATANYSTPSYPATNVPAANVPAANASPANYSTTSYPPTSYPTTITPDGLNHGTAPAMTERDPSLYYQRK